MSTKRIEHTTSRTAEMTCLTRAASSCETSNAFHSDDYLAVALLPTIFGLLVHSRLFRRFYRRVFVPAGVYEYVIARTKYVDTVFKNAMAENIRQVLLFGAGFDTRALRFPAETVGARVFELDAPHTQQAKIRQYQKRELLVPSNVDFIPIDFDKDSLPQKLATAGFRSGTRSLFILEGLLMYLEPASVQTTLHTIQDYAGAGSWIVFDYVQASVLGNVDAHSADAALRSTVSRAGEQWRFGIEPNAIGSFLATFGFAVVDHEDAQALEDRYFRDSSGHPLARVNASHCIVRGVKT